MWQKGDGVRGKSLPRSTYGTYVDGEVLHIAWDKTSTDAGHTFYLSYLVCLPEPMLAEVRIIYIDYDFTSGAFPEVYFSAV